MLDMPVVDADHADDCIGTNVQGFCQKAYRKQLCFERQPCSSMWL